MLCSCEPEARVEAWVKVNTEGIGSVLDLGCGRCEYLKIVSAQVKVGIDLFLPYLEETSGRLRNSSMTLIHGDILEWQRLTQMQCECAMLIDVIEHLPKPEATSLLSGLMLADGIKRILVFTPFGFHEQHDVDGNEHNRHLSAWLPEDLEPMGFRVTVNRGFHEDKPEGQRAAIFAVWNRA